MREILMALLVTLGVLLTALGTGFENIFVLGAGVQILFIHIQIQLLFRDKP